MSLRQVFGKMNRSLSKHSTEILLVGGATSLIYSGVKIVQATIKSVRDIDKKLEEKQKEAEETIQEDEESAEVTIEKKEIVQTVWKNYIPAVAAAAFGFACIFESDHIHRKGKSALLTLYALSEADRLDFKKQAEKVVGKNKVKEIEQEVVQERVKKETETMPKSHVIETGHGNTLIRDAFSGQYFRCDVEYIRKKCNDLTYRMWSAMEMDLNDFYMEIDGLEQNDGGDMVGWIADDGPIEPYFVAAFSAWGEPCANMSFTTPPHYLR